MNETSIQCYCRAARPQELNRGLLICNAESAGLGACDLQVHGPEILCTINTEKPLACVAILHKRSATSPATVWAVRRDEASDTKGVPARPKSNILKTTVSEEIARQFRYHASPRSGQMPLVTSKSANGIGVRMLSLNLVTQRKVLSGQLGRPLRIFQLGLSNSRGDAMASIAERTVQSLFTSDSKHCPGQALRTNVGTGA